MDPQSEKTPGLALPSPAMEQGSPNAMPAQPAAGSHEATLPGREHVQGSMQAPPMMPPQMSSTPVQQPAPVPPAADPAAAAASVPSDDNTDALDEEWINKAKAIVEQTKHDPHLESSELSKVKAEYLRIRYNKHIKVTDEQSK